MAAVTRPPRMELKAGQVVGVSWVGHSQEVKEERERWTFSLLQSYRDDVKHCF